jgi:sulfatase-like protein
MSTAEAAERPAAPDSERHAGLKAALWSYAHLAVLSCFAVAQPVFDLLRKNPEFFAARGSPGFDIISFSVLMVVLPPALLLAIELLGGLIHRRVGQALHLAFIAGLVGLIAVQALKDAFEASDAVLIGLSVAIGAAAAALYARAEPVRSFMNVLSPAPAVFLILFLFFSPVEKLAFPGEATAKSVNGVSRANVVVVLFDELPVNSLMDRTGHVDAKRYPAFAELERTSTWFRNAYTIYDSTERAQPAIFDGDYPEKDKLPTAADHPNSIFTLFAKTHRVHASEEATSVCPRDICKDERLQESYGDRMKSLFDDLGLVWLHVATPPGMERDLASVSENWGNFGGDQPAGGGGPGDQPNTRANLNRNRNKRFNEWVDGIHAGKRPSLDFKHALLPHIPWQYLPDAKQYRRTARDPIPQLSSEAFNDRYQIESLYQRHLLQLGFTDHELGRLLRRLKEQGMYDKSLVVVAADHGVAFDLGKRDRRKITRENAEEIGPIPFFIKAPGQHKARINPAYAESVDILPTIFDVLNVGPKVKMDGKSAFSPQVARRKTIRIFERNTFKPLRFDEGDWERRRKAAFERKLRIFGVGAEGPLRLFQIGPRQDLLFKPVSDFQVTPGSGASFVAPDEFRHVDLRSPTIPVHVTGHLKDLPTGREVAIAVNGKIEAVTKSFHLATNDDVIFAAMVPEGSFHQGANKVELFEVTGGSSLRRLGSV